MPFPIQGNGIFLWVAGFSRLLNNLAALTLKHIL